MRYLKGRGKVVSADPIQLTVSSPNVPNLTLVDMPGESACLPIELWTGIAGSRRLFCGCLPHDVMNPMLVGCPMSPCLCVRSTLV